MSPSLQPQYRQQFIPLLPDYNRPRELSSSSSTSGSASSIWAPQPQSPSGTWPKNANAFEDVPSHEPKQSPEQDTFPALNNSARPITKEDVFGPPNVTQPLIRRELGAIGEGRQRSFPLDSGDVRL